MAKTALKSMLFTIILSLVAGLSDTELPKLLTWLESHINQRRSKTKVIQINLAEPK